MATLTERAGYWILNWSDGQGRHRTSLGRTDVLPKAEALSILRAKQYELSTGATILRANRAPVATFGEFCRQYIPWHNAEYPDSHFRVAQIVEQHLLPKFEFTPLDRMTISDVEEWKTGRRFRVRGSTVTKELRVLQAILNRAVTMGLIPANPVAAVKAPRQLDSKPHRFYEADELARLYVGTYAAVWKLMANTGIRRGEAQMLRWSWIGAESLKILSTDDERTKGGHWREIPLSDGAREALGSLPRVGDYVLAKVAPESLSRAFLRDARRAGLDGSLHTLRHTYISHLVRLGVPIRTVQLYAGHAHITTTEKYAYLSPGTAPAPVLRLAL